jgi:hypothetical protein
MHGTSVTINHTASSGTWPFVHMNVSMYITEHYTTKTYGCVELPLIHPKTWNRLLVRVAPSEPRKEFLMA